MTTPAENPPSGSSRAEQSELGEPEQVTPGESPHEERLPPDLDARQRNLSTVRKSAGPRRRARADMAEGEAPDSTQEPSDPEPEGR